MRKIGRGDLICSRLTCCIVSLVEQFGCQSLTKEES
jgi:hypothetical protein